MSTSRCSTAAESSAIRAPQHDADEMSSHYVPNARIRSLVFKTSGEASRHAALIVERLVRENNSAGRPTVLEESANLRYFLRVMTDYGLDDAFSLFYNRGERVVVVVAEDGGAVGGATVAITNTESHIERTATTAIQDGDDLVEKCRALRDLGVQHVVVIARGRPLTDADLNCVASAADYLAGLAHTPG